MLIDDATARQVLPAGARVVRQPAIGCLRHLKTEHSPDEHGLENHKIIEHKFIFPVPVVNIYNITKLLCKF